MRWLLYKSGGIGMKFSYCVTITCGTAARSAIRMTTTHSATILAFFVCLLPTKSICMSEVCLNGTFALCVVCRLAYNDCEEDTYRAETKTTIKKIEKQLVVLTKLFNNQQALLAQTNISFSTAEFSALTTKSSEQNLQTPAPISAQSPNAVITPPSAVLMISAHLPTAEPLSPSFSPTKQLMMNANRTLITEH